MDHKCDQSEAINRLQESDKRYFDLLYGKNPPPGIIQTIGTLSQSVDILIEKMPKFEEKIDVFMSFKTSEEACKSSKAESLKMVGLYLGLLVSISFGIMNYTNTQATANNSQNTIITDPATLEQAMREGKNIKMRGAEVSNQYEKNYQEGINEMNK